MQTLKRCGSSAWLEYMPVTHGVASSSLVRTAVERGDEQQKDFGPGCSFFFFVYPCFYGSADFPVGGEDVKSIVLPLLLNLQPLHGCG